MNSPSFGATIFLAGRGIASGNFAAFPRRSEISPGRYARNEDRDSTTSERSLPGGLVRFRPAVDTGRSLPVPNGFVTRHGYLNVKFATRSRANSCGLSPRRGATAEGRAVVVNPARHSRAAGRHCCTAPERFSVTPIRHSRRFPADKNPFRSGRFFAREDTRFRERNAAKVLDDAIYGDRS